MKVCYEASNWESALKNEWVWFDRSQRIWRSTAASDPHPPPPYACQLFNPNLSDVSNVFEYLPLGPTYKEIRLLLLYPKCSHSGPPEHGLICGDIVHVSLLDHPWFVALSYVWGDDTHTIPIRIGNSLFHIRQNLWAALAEYQTSDIVVPIWADAICIDQKNIQEKSWQVQMMGAIFREAGAVMGWLGPAQDDSDMAIEKAKRLSTEFKLHQEPETRIKKTWEKCCSGHSRESEIPILKAFDLLCERPFWKRAWILQELTLAKTLIFFSGSSAISLEDLTIATRVYSAASSWFPIADRVRREEGGFKRVKSNSHVGLMLTTIQAKAETRGFTRKMKDLLSMDNRLASDGRDQIYSLLSIASDANDLGIVPDYSKPNCLVYEELAVRYLETMQDLDLLAYCQFPKKLDGLPTWVPDWSMDLNPRMDYNLRYTQPFRACGYRTASSRVRQESDDSISLLTLHLHGSKVGTVQDLGRDWTLFKPSLTNEQYLCLKIINDLLELASNHDEYPSTYEMDQAIFKIPVVDFDAWQSLSKVYQGRAGSDLYQSYRAMLQLRDIVANEDKTPVSGERNDSRLVENDDSISNNDFASKEHTASFQKKIELFKSARQYSCRVVYEVLERERRFFKTSKGHIGLGPKSLLVGDTICILAGCEVPFALRPVGSRFQLLGETYTYGIMDGELFANEEPEMQEFVLL